MRLKPFRNVASKAKALREFKAEGSDVRVIMLSLDKAASGTNLVEASHIILIGMFLIN